MFDDLIKNIENYKEFLIACKGATPEQAEKSASELKKLTTYKPKKYGLVWEDKEEVVADELKNSIPFLEEYTESCISNGGYDEPHHLLIEGDNLEVLKLLMTTHKEKISVIYIDPPYFTGNNDFCYNDSFLSKEDSWRHSTWLSFMSKRLSLAKKLLADDGVIFISIDEHEFAQLKLLCDEIFGEENFIENFIWIKNSTKNNSKTTSTNHEYILCYSKSVERVRASEVFRVEKEGLSLVNELCARFVSEEAHLYEEPHFELEKRLKILYKENPNLKGISSYKFVEPITFKLYSSGDCSAPNGNGARFEIIHPITKKPCKLPSRGYSCTEETMLEMIKQNQIIFGKDETTVIRSKRYLDTVETEVARSIFVNNDDGKKELDKIFGKTPFSYPKPVSVIKHILSMIPNKNAIILDFFAGSGTTGQAVLELNQEDGGNRQFILCTNNEVSDKKAMKYFGFKQAPQLKKFKLTEEYKERIKEESYQELGICREVTYPRLSKVINGYVTPGNKKVDGIPASLKYYKVNKFEKRDYTEEELSLLYIEHSIPLLQIKHNAFNLVSKSSHGWVYESEQMRFGVLNDMAVESDFQMIKQNLEDYQGEKIVYLFSMDSLSYPKYTTLESLDEFIKPIPREIIQLLMEV